MAGFTPDINNPENSFRQLFDAYAERVHQYIFYMTKSDYLTEEITQELFMILWRKRDGLHLVENMDGYIFRIARNMALKLLKKAAMDAKLAAELYKASVKESNTTEHILSGKAVQELVEEAIAALPPQPRKVFQMSRKQNMTIDEIAEATGLSRNTVKNHLQKALNEVRDYLIKNGYHLAIATLLASQMLMEIQFAEA